MALPLRPRSAPQCMTCLRRYAFIRLEDAAAPASALRQQIRGKRKMVNNSATVTVRLLQDMKTWGRKGTLVPIARGEMRNKWFPGGVAEYVTMPELKTLRLKNVAVERDFQYGTQDLRRPRRTTTADGWGESVRDTNPMSKDEVVSASAFQKKVDLERLSPERSVELLEKFVRPRLEFYRQPIIEEKEEKKEKEPEAPVQETKKKAQSYATGAAADLLAARTRSSDVAKAIMGEKKDGKPQAIYGSVSPLDVLQAVRAAMAEDEEAQRVVLAEQDVQFVDLPETEGDVAKVVKHVGDFEVEIRVKGAETAVRRVVGVISQEL